MAAIQKALLRMLFQLELLTLLNLERDFDTRLVHERKREGETELGKKRRGETENGLARQRVVASRILNIIGAKKTRVETAFKPSTAWPNAGPIPSKTYAHLLCECNI